MSEVIILTDMCAKIEGGGRCNRTENSPLHDPKMKHAGFHGFQSPRASLADEDPTSTETTTGEARARAQLNGIMNCLATTQQEVERLRAVREPSVELVFQNESGMGYDRPFVAVAVNGVEVDRVEAYTDRAQGADGGWYPVIRFRRTGATP